jgi:hypothetical protein
LFARITSPQSLISRLSNALAAAGGLGGFFAMLVLAVEFRATLGF